MGTSYVKSSTSSVVLKRRIDAKVESTRPDIVPPSDTTTYQTLGNGKEDLYLSGYRNPGWRRIIESGGNANSELLASKRVLKFVGHSGTAFGRAKKFSTGPSRYVTYSKTIPYGLAWLPEPSDPVLPVLTSDALNEAKVKLNSRISSVQTAFQGGIYLGEARETVMFLAGGTRSLRQAFERYLTQVRKRVERSLRTVRSPTRTKKRKKAGGSLRDRKIMVANSVIADQWLALQLAIKPLVSDVQSAGEALARLDTMTDMDDRQIVRVTVTKRASSFVDWGNGDPGFWYDNSISAGGSPTLPLKYRVRDDDSVRVTLRASVRAKRAGKAGVLQYLGFEPGMFAPTLWNLLPHSYLIDYFTNIGDIVNSWAVWFGDLEWCWRTTLTQRVRLFDDVQMSMATFLATYPTASGWSAHELTFTRPSPRWIVSSLSRQNHGLNLLPEFRFELPGANQWRKYANIAALLRNSRAVSTGLNNLLN